MSASEQVIKKAIIDMFEKRGVIAWVNHAGKVKVKGGWMQLSPKGTPDIIAIVEGPGRLLGLEVKDAKGKNRPSQDAWNEVATAHGAHVATVRTPEEAWKEFVYARNNLPKDWWTNLSTMDPSGELDGGQKA